MDGYEHWTRCLATFTLKILYSSGHFLSLYTILSDIRLFSHPECGDSAPLLARAYREWKLAITGSSCKIMIVLRNATSKHFSYFYFWPASIIVLMKIPVADPQIKFRLSSATKSNLHFGMIYLNGKWLWSTAGPVTVPAIIPAVAWTETVATALKVAKDEFWQRI